MEAEKKNVLDSLIANLNVLPNDAVDQIAKYVSGLKEEYEDIQLIEASPLRPMEEESFVGLWSDRPDMADSSGTIRRLRKG